MFLRAPGRSRLSFSEPKELFRALPRENTGIRALEAYFFSGALAPMYIYT